MRNKLDLTVILPTLNESKTIKKIINNININLKRKIFYQILVSDNCSNDNTVEIVRNIKNVKVISVKNQGYGINLRSAIKIINSKYAIFFDADGSYDPSHILPMYKKITKENLDLVYLNRLQEQEKGSMPFLNKYFGTPLLTFFINFFHGKKGGGGGGDRAGKVDEKIKDCNSGMRIFKSSKIKKINFISNGMEFASEFFIEAIKNKLKFRDYEGLFRKDLRSRRPHLRPWADGWRHLHLILSSAPTKVFNFLFIIILINYSLGFYLTLFLTNTSIIKYYLIVLLISLNLFFQIECVSISNFKQKYRQTVNDYSFNYVLNLHKKNFFIFSSIILLLFSTIESFIVYVFPNNYYFNFDVVLRFIIFANLSAFMISLEMALDKNSL